MTLSQAFCKDLRDGLTPMNIYGGTKRHFDGPEDFANKIHGMVLLSCPEQLDTNESLRALLVAWDINPDLR